MKYIASTNVPFKLMVASSDFRIWKMRAKRNHVFLRTLTVWTLP